MVKHVGNGRLRHRFHGTYSAVIAIGFETDAAAAEALRRFGSGWQLGTKNSNAIVWSGDSAALDRVKALLAGFGADPRKIDSIAKSIDFGEPFTVEIELPHPDQLSLVPA